MDIAEKYNHIIEYFLKEMPCAQSELVFNSPYQLIVAVILSAQCTDKRVNLTTPALFEKYPDVKSLSKASFEDVLMIIKSISYPNNKARHLIDMANMIVSDFNGEIPSEIGNLQKLPGVGRKTANVVASIIFDKPVIAVDTHVFRVARRIGLSDGTTPLSVEMDLTERIAPELRPLAHHWLILHGRYVCVARKPDCPNCGIKEWCDYYIDSV